MNITEVYPLIIPSYYISPSWNLPYQEFSNTSFVLTWVHFKDSGIMNYLTEKDLNEFNQNNSGWQQQAFENLRNSGQYFYTDIKVNSINKVIFLAFLNTDGIGSSRILLNFELSKIFQKGYYIAFPDRSCGLIISKAITDAELKETGSLIKKMYASATIPMTDKIFEPVEFILPLGWNLPLDNELSEQLINSVPKESIN